MPRFSVWEPLESLGRIFRFTAALRAKFCSRIQLVLAVGAFSFFLRRAAFRAELCAFAKLGSALNAGHFRHFHLAAAVRAEFHADGVLLSARRARNGRRLSTATLIAWLISTAERIRHLAADGKAGTQSGS